MVELVGIALALASGADPRRLAILASALYLPVAVLTLAALAIWTNRRARTARSALFCEGAAAELRSGANLRDAITAALSSVGGQAIGDGSIATLTGEVAGQFEDIGTELEVSITAASAAGASVADLFDEIGSFAIARSEVDNEVRIATAPARVTAFVFLAAPVAYLGSRVASGQLGALLSLPHQRVAAIAGLILFVVGFVIALLVLWRSQ